MTARIADKNGWFEVPANPISKAGVFQYRGASLPDAPDANALYNVYRPASELSNAATMNSFRLVPLINDHVMLGDVSKPGHVPAEMKGVHGVTGEKVWFNPNDEMLYSNLKVFSSSLDDAIDAGKKHLSVGYRCKYIKQSGIAPDGTPYDYVQTAINGNHIALVKAGRCGNDVAVMDHIAFDEKDIVIMASLKERNAKAHKALVKSIIGSYVSKLAIKPANASAYAMDAADDEAVASEPSLSDIKDLLGDVMPVIADINSSLASGNASPDDDMEAEMDAAGKPVMDAAGKPVMKKKAKPAAVVDAKAEAKAMDEAIDRAIKAGKLTVATDSAAMDAAFAAHVKPLAAQFAELKNGASKVFMKEIASRETLARALTPFVGAFDHSEMTHAEVAAYGVKKLDVPAMDGQEIGAITAWLHGRRAPAAPSFGMDAANTSGSSIDNWLAGK